MIGRALRHCGGAAAAEMALVTPLILILMTGSVELGNYFLDEHILVKGVRDGAVYAARQDVATYYNCASAPTVSSTVVNNTKQLVRSGQLSGGTDRLPNWTSGGTTFTVTFACVTSAGGTTLGGIYLANGGQVPVVTVTAQLPYRAVLSDFGFKAVNFNLNATEQAVVSGA